VVSKITIGKGFKIFLALILTAAISVVTACSTTPDISNGQSHSLNVNQPAPDFTLRDLDGNLVALSNFRGKPVYFNYWASWCPSCIDEMPIVQSVYDDWAKRGLVLFTVNAGEDLATVLDFMQKNHYTFPVLLDSQDKVDQEYNIYYIPVSVFVDKQGKIKSKVIGALAVKAALEKQLATIFNSP
jgi:peroxiredoxin